MADASAGPTRGFRHRHRPSGIRATLHRTFSKGIGWGALEWVGEGLEEVGRRSDTGAAVVRVDPRYFRPTEVETLLGDPSGPERSSAGLQVPVWSRWLMR